VARLARRRDPATGALDGSLEIDPDGQVTNLPVTAHWLERTPLHPAHLRAPGRMANPPRP
jgi:hypothetical protein